MRTGSLDGPSQAVAAAGTTTEVRRVAAAGLVGTVIEWYDFFCYGTAAALVFGPQFFPSISPTAGTLAALGTFAVGYVARPLGGAVMGHLGDRVGRKRMLVVSLALMGVATFAIGLLPGFATIGVAAPILLVLLRFVQGFAVGGEWGGAVLLAVEHAAPRRRTLYGSIPQMGLPLGVVLATGVFALVRGPLSAAEFAAWGWRIPFLLGVVLVVVGLVVRIRLSESPQFLAARERQDVSRIPVGDVLRHKPGALLLSAGLAIVVAGLGNVLLVYVLTYATAVVGIAASTMLWVTAVAAVAWAAAIPVAALWAERVGRRRVLLLGIAGCAVWGFPYFWMINTGVLGLVLLATVGAALVSALAAGPHAAFVSEAFPVRLRYTGVSIGYAIGAALGGALTPLVATGLFAATGTAYAIAAYLLVIGAISFVSAALLRSPVGE